MFQVHNTTPFNADLALLANAQGLDTLYPILKGTFDVKDLIEIAAEQVPLNKTDEYRDDPLFSGIKHSGDYHLPKPCTDVLVNGDCFLADGSDFQQTEVNLQVGELRQQLTLFGERFWDRGYISSPSHVARVPLIYEMAYGGTANDGTAYESNPIGRGFAASEDLAQYDGLALPLIEHSDQLIQSIHCRPQPAGFEAIPPHWPARRQYAGTYDEQWQRARAPYLPEDFNSYFFQCANRSLIAQHRLRGGEPVCVTNMSPDGQWEFDLPYVELSCAGLWMGQAVDIPLRLETLTLYPNAQQLTMTWRGALAVNQWASRFEYVEFCLKSIK